jgi:hypothetical protein
MIFECKVVFFSLSSDSASLVTSNHLDTYREQLLYETKKQPAIRGLLWLAMVYANRNAFSVAIDVVRDAVTLVGIAAQSLFQDTEYIRTVTFIKTRMLDFQDKAVACSGLLDLTIMHLHFRNLDLATIFWVDAVKTAIEERHPLDSERLKTLARTVIKSTCLISWTELLVGGKHFQAIRGLIGAFTLFYNAKDLEGVAYDNKDRAQAAESILGKDWVQAVNAVATILWTIHRRFAPLPPPQRITEGIPSWVYSFLRKHAFNKCNWFLLHEYERIASVSRDPEELIELYVQLRQTESELRTTFYAGAPPCAVYIIEAAKQYAERHCEAVPNAGEKAEACMRRYMAVMRDQQYVSSNDKIFCARNAYAQVAAVYILNHQWPHAELFLEGSRLNVPELGDPRTWVGEFLEEYAATCRPNNNKTKNVLFFLAIGNWALAIEEDIFKAAVAFQSANRLLEGEGIYASVDTGTSNLFPLIMDISKNAEEMDVLCTMIFQFYLQRINRAPSDSPLKRNPEKYLLDLFLFVRATAFLYALSGCPDKAAERLEQYCQPTPLGKINGQRKTEAYRELIEELSRQEKTKPVADQLSRRGT